MHGDLFDALQTFLGVLLGWFVAWLRQRRKQSRPGMRARVGLVLLVGLLAAGSASCQVARCVKGCISPPPPPAAEPAPSPSPAPPATR